MTKNIWTRRTKICYVVWLDVHKERTLCSIMLLVLSQNLLLTQVLLKPPLNPFWILSLNHFTKCWFPYELLAMSTQATTVGCCVLQYKSVKYLTMINWCITLWQKNTVHKCIVTLLPSAVVTAATLCCNTDTHPLARLIHGAAPWRLTALCSYNYYNPLLCNTDSHPLTRLVRGAALSGLTALCSYNYCNPLL